MKIERLVYFGTAPIAVPALEALAALPDVQVVAVCTQPDRTSGRKRKLTPSPVKEVALRLGLPVFDPEKIGDAEEALRVLEPDLGMVFAYGQYLPSRIFDLPTLGSVNFHPSRLPEYRGASPIQSAIADGHTESALSLIQVGKQMDAGDIWWQEDVTIGPEDTSALMHDRFGALAGERVPELLQGLRNGTLERRPQEEALATECGKISKQDGAVDWTLPAEVLWNRVRAYDPWPGVFVPFGEAGNLKLLSVQLEDASGAVPGEVLSVEKSGPVVACGEGSLRFLRVQPPGKKPMSGGDFLNGHPLTPGDILASGDA